MKINSQNKVLGNLSEMILNIKGKDFLLTEKDLSEKYNVDMEKIISIEKKALNFELDIKESKERRRKVLANLYNKGLDFYNEIEEGEKSDFTDALIVNDKGQLLLLKRGNQTKLEPNKWLIAGGHKERFLSFEMNVKKEIKEETGLDTLKCQLINVKSISNGRKIYYFLCTFPKEQEVVLNEKEHTQYQWMSVADMKKMEDKEFAFDFKEYLFKTLLGIDNENI